MYFVNMSLHTKNKFTGLSSMGSLFERRARLILMPKPDLSQQGINKLGWISPNKPDWCVERHIWGLFRGALTLLNTDPYILYIYIGIYININSPEYWPLCLEIAKSRRIDNMSFNIYIQIMTLPNTDPCAYI